MFLLSVVGILIAGYLWKMHATPELIPCGRGRGCETVALSPYSRFPYGTGLPIAAWGTLGYIGLTVLSLLRMMHLPTRILKPVWILQGAGLITGMCASVLLTIIQAVIIKAFCKWCLASEVIMSFMLIVFIVEWRAWQSDTNQTRKSPS